MINFPSIGKVRVPAHLPNQKMDGIEVSLPVGSQFKTNVAVSALPVRPATLASRLSSGKSSIPSILRFYVRKVMQRSCFPKQKTVFSIKREALLKKLHGWKGLALASTTTDNWSRLMTHCYEWVVGLEAPAMLNTSRGFAI